jgi:hypothetical protein
LLKKPYICTVNYFKRARKTTGEKNFCHGWKFGHQAQPIGRGSVHGHASEGKKVSVHGGTEHQPKQHHCVWF